MHIHCLQHVSFENPGTILEWVAAHNHTISFTYFFEDDFVLPEINNFDCLIVLGGYMNVYEEQNFPWLKEEKAFIKKVIDSNKKILGICLGSQLLATIFGAKVLKNKSKEIGFFPIVFNEQSKLNPTLNHFKQAVNVFHWHEDTFEIPADATRICSSVICENQGFNIGNSVLALQFHMEVTEEIIENLIKTEPQAFEQKEAFVQSAAEIRSNYKYLAETKVAFFNMLNKFFNAN